MKAIVFLVALALALLILGQRRSDVPTFSSTQLVSPRVALQALIAPRDVLASMPRVPPPDDATAELNELVRKQSALTPARLSQIRRQLVPRGVFADLGATAADVRELTPFFNRVVNPVIAALKMEYNRVRPSFLDPRLRPAIPNPPHAAYPSGHATQAYTASLLLAQKYPQRRQQLMRAARNVAVNREYAGVHYASDSAYGLLLAHALVKEAQR